MLCGETSERPDCKNKTSLNALNQKKKSVSFIACQQVLTISVLNLQPETIQLVLCQNLFPVALLS